MPVIRPFRSNVLFYVRANCPVCTSLHEHVHSAMYKQGWFTVRLLQYPSAYNDSLTVAAAFGFVNKLLYQDACQPDPKNCACPYSQAITGQSRIFIFLAAIPHLRCVEFLSDQSGDGQASNDGLYLVDMKGFRIIYSDKKRISGRDTSFGVFSEFLPAPTN